MKLHLPVGYNTTFALLKPDCVRDNNIDHALRMIRQAKMRPIVMALVQPDADDINLHYLEHMSKPFFTAMREFLLSGPSLAMLIVSETDEDVVAKMRNLVGAYNSLNPATIRGALRKYGAPPYENVIHASVTAQEADREAAIWFSFI